MLNNFKLSTQIIKAPLSLFAFAQHKKNHSIKSSLKEHAEIYREFIRPNIQIVVFIYAHKIIEMRIESKTQREKFKIYSH